MRLFKHQAFKRSAVAVAAAALLSVGFGPAQALPVVSQPARADYMPQDDDPTPVPCRYAEDYKDPRTKAMSEPDELFEWYEMCSGFWISPVPL